MRCGILILLAFFLISCQTSSEVNLTIPTVTQGSQKIDAQLDLVTVQLAPDNLRRGYLPPETVALIPAWESSIQDALRQTSIFSLNARTVANIRVNIIQMESRHNDDLSITTTTIASYEVLNAQTQELLWIRGLSSTNTVTYQDAMVEGTRKQTSINRSIQNNISQFIQLLSGAPLQTKPVAERELRIMQK